MLHVCALGLHDALLDAALPMLCRCSADALLDAARLLSSMLPLLSSMLPLLCSMLPPALLVLRVPRHYRTAFATTSHDRAMTFACSSDQGCCLMRHTSAATAPSHRSTPQASSIFLSLPLDHFSRFARSSISARHFHLRHLLTVQPPTIQPPTKMLH
jgi:hypothetical protein